MFVAEKTESSWPFIDFVLFVVVIGIPIEVTYLADENGYQPSGPGVHPAIQRAVAAQVALAKQEQLQQTQIRN